MLTRAVELIGTNYTKLVRLGKAEKIILVDVCSVKYIAKESLILYLITPEATLDPHLGNYKKILSEFKKKQCRVRENEKRKQNRTTQKKIKIHKSSGARRKILPHAASCSLKNKRHKS